MERERCMGNLTITQVTKIVEEVAQFVSSTSRRDFSIDPRRIASTVCTSTDALAPASTAVYTDDSRVQRMLRMFAEPKLSASKPCT